MNYAEDRFPEEPLVVQVCQYRDAYVGRIRAHLDHPRTFYPHNAIRYITFASELYPNHINRNDSTFAQASDYHLRYRFEDHLFPGEAFWALVQWSIDHVPDSLFIPFLRQEHLFLRQPHLAHGDLAREADYVRRALRFCRIAPDPTWGFVDTVERLIQNFGLADNYRPILNWLIRTVPESALAQREAAQRIQQSFRRRLFGTVYNKPE